MMPKQRILAAIRGQAVDKIPWCPFLAYYWESLPASVTAQGQIPFLEGVGADPLLRGSHCLSRIAYGKTEIEDQTKGGERRVVYHAPAGDLVLRYTYAANGDTWFLTEHPVKRREDYAILASLFEDMTVQPDLEAFERDKAAAGDRALYVPVIGFQAKTAFQAMVEHWVGTVQLTYDLMDYPETVAACLEVLQAVDRKTLDAALESSAEAFISWEDTSTTNISPRLFAQYIAPQLNEWSDRIHGQGRLFIHHACGHVRDLLPLIAQTHIDALESLSPPPTGNATLAQARAALPDRIALIGGIEPTELLQLPLNAFPAYVEGILGEMEGSRYVLANSDSCPPGVDYAKWELITRLRDAHCAR